MRKSYKAVTFFLIIVLTVSVYSMAFAKDKYDSIQDLFTDWEVNGYPDYVGGVYSQDGGEQLVVMLVNDSEEGKNEILDLLIDDNTVSFKTAKYSHNQLKEINDKIVEEMNQHKHIYTCGIDDMQNKLRIGVDQDVYENLNAEYSKLYGDMVDVYISTPVYPVSVEVGSKNSELYIYITILLGVLIISGTIVFVALVHHRKLMNKKNAK